MAVTFDTASTQEGSSGTSTMSWAHTLTTAGVVLVGVGARTTASTTLDVSGVTIGGTAATLIASTFYIYAGKKMAVNTVWGLKAVSSGAQTIDVTLTESPPYAPAGCAVSFGNTSGWDSTAVVQNNSAGTNSFQTSISLDGSSNMLAGFVKADFNPPMGISFSVTNSTGSIRAEASTSGSTSIGGYCIGTFVANESTLGITWGAILRNTGIGIELLEGSASTGSTGPPPGTTFIYSLKALGVGM